MVFFREVRDKMRDGPFLSSSMQRDFMKPLAGRGGGAGQAAPGSYIAKLSVGGKEYMKPVTVLEDRWKNQ